MTTDSASLAIDALVFDAYGALFDVRSVATLAERLAPGRVITTLADLPPLLAGT